MTTTTTTTTMATTTATATAADERKKSAKELAYTFDLGKCSLNLCNHLVCLFLLHAHVCVRGCAYVLSVYELICVLEEIETNE